MIQAQPSSVATRNGVIAGVILGILSLPVITFSAIGRLLNRLSGLPLLFLLVALVVFAIAGFSAARRNGLLRSAVWAGFLAGLITAFIAVCLGVVILTLMAPYALVAPRVAPGPRAGRALVATLARTVLLRLIAAGLALLALGAGAGLIGGLLGRIGRPRGAGGPGAPYAADAYGPQPQGFAPPPMQAYAPSYTPTPQAGPTPQPYYPTALPYDDSAPTTVRDSQA